MYKRQTFAPCAKAVVSKIVKGFTSKFIVTWISAIPLSKSSPTTVELTRTPLNEYFQKFGVFLRRLNNNRYLLVLNERIYREIAADRFSILNIVRKASQKAEVSITLSMAFAKGSSNFAELDETVTKLMDLAQTLSLIHI